MSENEPQKPSPQAPRRVSRWRSLVWFIPERFARRLGWAFVVILCVLPVAVILALVIQRHIQKPEHTLAALLSERLGARVTVRRAVADAYSHCALADVAIEALSLRSPLGAWQGPAQGSPGRLDLENGTLSADLDAFTKPPSRALIGALQQARAHSDLRALSFSGFTLELSLAKERVVIERCVGRAELTDEGNIHGTLTGRCGRDRVGITFDITDTSQTAVVTGRPLPWARTLLAPTLGALAERLENLDGKLTLGSDLATGSDSADTWRLDAKASLDLSRLPEELGLAGLTGRTNVTFQAFGAIGKPATIAAPISLSAGATGAATAEALRRLSFLVTGSWIQIMDDGKPLTFDAIECSVIITHDQVYFTAARSGRPAGLFAPGGVRLLAIPSGEGIPIREFLKRLDDLNRRWQMGHSS